MGSTTVIYWKNAPSSITWLAGTATSTLMEVESSCDLEVGCLKGAMERLRVVVEGFHRLGLKRVEWKEYYLLKSVGEKN